MSGRVRRHPDPSLRELRLLLEADVQRQQDRAIRPGAVYRSAEELILDAGVRWPWRSLDREWSPGVTKWGLERACFANAIIACLNHRDLRYVEGFAYSGLTAIHHAWNVDERGRVVDFTWKEHPLLRTGRAYLGVVVPIERAFDATWAQGETVLRDPPRFAVLMEQWPRDDNPPRPSDERIVEMLQTHAGTRYDALIEKFGLESEAS